MVRHPPCARRHTRLKCAINRFKLHLRPKTKSAAHVTEDIPPLPQGKTAIDVFADFMRYLFKCARLYIEQTHGNGVELWRGLQSSVEFVLTHPNGWEGAQQTMMRKAAVVAGLVPDTEGGRSRLSFVTEGEASLHFCIRSGSTSEATKVRRIVFITRESYSHYILLDWERDRNRRCRGRYH